MKTILNRMKSWATWVSVFGAVFVILQATGVTTKWGITSDVWNSVITSIGTILVGFGILNNPTDHDNF